MRRFRLLATLLVLPWLLMAAVGGRYVLAAPAQAGAQTFTVLVGNQIHTDPGEKPTWQGQNFYPGTITINEGDSIVWKHNAGVEPHTVSFMGPLTTTGELVMVDTSAPPAPGAPPKLIFNPTVINPAGGATYDGSAFTNSGFVASDIPVPQEYKLTFPKAGSYDYVCLLHSARLPTGTIVGMKGKVIVQAAGSALPMTPDEVLAEGQKQISSDAARAAQLEPGIEASAKPAEQMSDGTMKYYVTAGNMDMERNLEYQRFYPKELHVKVGDTVEWALGMAPAFHTVTIGDEPDLFSNEPQPGGPPKVVFNPAVAFPAGGPVHTGTGYYNSGPLAGPDDPPQAGVKTYPLKFTKVGRYEYICVPHYSLGMLGTIVVEDATGGSTGGGTVGMPQTGAGDNGTGWLLPALLALILALSGAAVRVIANLRKSV